MQIVDECDPIFCFQKPVVRCAARGLQRIPRASAVLKILEFLIQSEKIYAAHANFESCVENEKNKARSNFGEDAHSISRSGVLRKQPQTTTRCWSLIGGNSVT